MIHDIAEEQSDVVQRVVQLVGNTGRQFTQRGQFPGLHQLLLLLAELLLAALHLFCRFTQTPHDVNHGLAAALQPLVRKMDILQNMQKRAARIIQAHRLLRQPFGPAAPRVK